VRTLTGKVNGSISVVGKAATATVRNASWTVTDLCSGTKVKNRRGSVTVKARRSRKEVTVRPGGTYVAKARLFAAKRRDRDGTSAMRALSR
jgi:hypothetical protein